MQIDKTHRLSVITKCGGARLC